MKLDWGRHLTVSKTFLGLSGLLILNPSYSQEMRLLDLQGYAECSKPGFTKKQFDRCIKKRAPEPLKGEISLCAHMLNPNPRTCLGVQPYELYLSTPVMGREVPGFIDEVSPQNFRMGKQVIFRLSAQGSDTARDVSFVFVNRLGKVVGKPKFIFSDPESDSEFIGYGLVPREEFTLQTSGIDTHGTPYKHYLNQWFKPTKSGSKASVAKPLDHVKSKEDKMIEKDLRRSVIEYIDQNWPASGVVTMSKRNQITTPP